MSIKGSTSHLNIPPEVEDQLTQPLRHASDRRTKVHVGEDAGLATDSVLVPPVVLVQGKGRLPLGCPWEHVSSCDLDVSGTSADVGLFWKPGDCAARTE